MDHFSNFRPHTCGAGMCYQSQKIGGLQLMVQAVQIYVHLARRDNENVFPSAISRDGLLCRCSPCLKSVVGCLRPSAGVGSVHRGCPRLVADVQGLQQVSKACCGCLMPGAGLSEACCGCSSTVAAVQGMQQLFAACSGCSNSAASVHSLLRVFEACYGAVRALHQGYLRVCCCTTRSVAFV